MELPRPQKISGDLREQEYRYALAQKLLMLLAVGGLLLGLVFGGLGVMLVYLGATGNTSLKLFGQNLSTGSVGVASLFIAAVTVLVMTTRVLKAFRELISLGMKPK
jgi:hypothetical protein